jgi:DNA primase large subunit
METLNSALNGFPLSELGPACKGRVDALRAVNELSPGKPTVKPEVACVKTDQVTFLILAYACCIKHATWFSKHEAVRLMLNVEDLTVTEKVMLLHLLQVEVHADATYKSMLCIDFEHATRLVSARSVWVQKGSAYVNETQLASVIREAYDARLATFLKKCKVRLGEIGRINTQYYEPQYATVLSIMNDMQFYVCPVVEKELAGLECTAKTLPVAVAHFAPLCIVKLVVKLRVEKHLIDKERVTLRLWLRAVKVKLDVAVEFWSEHVGEKEKVRGPIAQAYAKEYACVGCAKIRTQGLCPFQDSDKAMLGWCEDVIPSAVQDIEDILKTSSCALDRCGRVFALRHGAIWKGPRNPANYFLQASEAGLSQSSVARKDGLGLQ